MPYEELRNYFRKHFGAKNFTKEVDYLTKYVYGRTTTKRQLSPYNCSTIIYENAPQAGDVHGCPFMHFDDENLNNLLRNFGTKREEVIVNSNSRRSCARLFNRRHHCDEMKIINSPTEYFLKSAKLLNEIDNQEEQFNESLINYKNLPNYEQLIAKTNLIHNLSNLSISEQFDDSFDDIDYDRLRRLLKQ